MVEELESRLDAMDSPITVHINGCPNSCARIQVADIGLKGQLVVGPNGDQVEGFQVHLGGGLGLDAGFGRKLRGHKVTADELPDYVERLARAYAGPAGRRRALRPVGHPRRRGGAGVTDVRPDRARATVRAVTTTRTARRCSTAPTAARRRCSRPSAAGSATAACGPSRWPSSVWSPGSVSDEPVLRARRRVPAGAELGGPTAACGSSRWRLHRVRRPEQARGAEVMSTTVDLSELAAQASRDLEGAPALEIMRWAYAEFGSGLVVTSSMVDTVMIHLAEQVAPGIDVIFLDTGYHFVETIGTRDAVKLWCTTST